MVCDGMCSCCRNPDATGAGTPNAAARAAPRALDDGAADGAAGRGRPPEPLRAHLQRVQVAQRHGAARGIRVHQ